VGKEFSPPAVGVSRFGFEGFNFIEEHLHVRGICGCRGCRISRQHYLVVAVDPGKCEGRWGNFRCVEDEIVESVEGKVSPSLQFSGWKNVVGRDDDFSLDTRQRFGDKWGQCRLLLFA
jgi:hypothetical protein